MPGGDFQIALGRRVAELRKRGGLTQAELAEKLSVSVETISRLERGATVPGVETLARLAKAMGAQPHEVLVFPSGRDIKGKLVEEISHTLRQLRLDDLRLAQDLVSVVHRRRKA